MEAAESIQDEDTPEEKSFSSSYQCMMCFRMFSSAVSKDAVVAQDTGGSEDNTLSICPKCDASHEEINQTHQMTLSVVPEKVAVERLTEQEKCYEDQYRMLQKKQEAVLLHERNLKLMQQKKHLREKEDRLRRAQQQLEYQQMKQEREEKEIQREEELQRLHEAPPSKNQQRPAKPRKVVPQGKRSDNNQEKKLDDAPTKTVQLPKIRLHEAGSSSKSAGVLKELSGSIRNDIETQKCYGQDLTPMADGKKPRQAQVIAPIKKPPSKKKMKTKKNKNKKKKVADVKTAPLEKIPLKGPVKLEEPLKAEIKKVDWYQTIKDELHIVDDHEGDSNSNNNIDAVNPSDVLHSASNVPFSHSSFEQNGTSNNQVNESITSIGKEISVRMAKYAHLMPPSLSSSFNSTPSCSSSSNNNNNDNNSHLSSHSPAAYSSTSTNLKPLSSSYTPPDYLKVILEKYHVNRTTASPSTTTTSDAVGEARDASANVPAAYKGDAPSHVKVSELLRKYAVGSETSSIASNDSSSGSQVNMLNKKDPLHLPSNFQHSSRTGSIIRSKTTLLPPMTLTTDMTTTTATTATLAEAPSSVPIMSTSVNQSELLLQRYLSHKK